MNSSSVLDRVHNLIGSDFSSQSVAELRESNIAIRHVRSWLDAMQSQIIEAMKSASLAHESVMPEVELIRESGLSGSDVRKVMARTETIGFIPVFGEALAEGNVTSAHVDALSNGLKTMGEQSERLVERAPELLETAQTMTADEFSQFVKHTVRSLTDDGGVSRFEKQRRQTFLRHWVDADGMTNLFGKFDPERGSVLTALLDLNQLAVWRSTVHKLSQELCKEIFQFQHWQSIHLRRLWFDKRYCEQRCVCWHMLGQYRFSEFYFLVKHSRIYPFQNPPIYS